MAKKKKLLRLLKRLLLKLRLRWKLLRWKPLLLKPLLLKLHLLKLHLLPSNFWPGNEKPAFWPVFLRPQKTIESCHGLAQAGQGLRVGKADVAWAWCEPKSSPGVAAIPVWVGPPAVPRGGMNASGCWR